METRRAVDVVTFGELVLKLMNECGMNQNQLALKSGLSRPHVNRIVHGEIVSPSIENAFAIADALGVDINVFRECEREEV